MVEALGKLNRLFVITVLVVRGHRLHLQLNCLIN